MVDMENHATIQDDDNSNKDVESSIWDSNPNFDQCNKGYNITQEES